jgi:hypothetical protein
MEAAKLNKTQSLPSHCLVHVRVWLVLNRYMWNTQMSNQSHNSTISGLKHNRLIANPIQKEGFDSSHVNVTYVDIKMKYTYVSVLYLNKKK